MTEILYLVLCSALALLGLVLVIYLFLQCVFLVEWTFDRIPERMQDVTAFVFLVVVAGVSLAGLSVIGKALCDAVGMCG